MSSDTYAQDEVTRPHIYNLCLRCAVSLHEVERNAVIVSPTGMAHLGTADGRTACGFDATGYRWWWPL